MEKYINEVEIEIVIAEENILTARIEKLKYNVKREKQLLRKELCQRRYALRERVTGDGVVSIAEHFSGVEHLTDKEAA